MKTHQKEKQLQASLDQFVKEKLHGRYGAHVSDTFLSKLLFQRLTFLCWKEKPEGQEHLPHPFERRENIAYDVGYPIFELNLEHHCRAGGNGHHVAQYLADWIKNFTFTK